MSTSLKIIGIIGLILAGFASAGELVGELSGPRLIRNRKRERLLEYVCTARATNEEGRTVTLLLKPKGRSVKLFLGQGVTVEGTATRTRIPGEEKVFYHFQNGLEAFAFKLTFSTNQSGDDAELRLVSGTDAIVCRYVVGKSPIAD